MDFINSPQPCPSRCFDQRTIYFVGIRLDVIRDEHQIPAIRSMLIEFSRYHALIRQSGIG